MSVLDANGQSQPLRTLTTSGALFEETVSLLGQLVITDGSSISNYDLYEICR